ncbi:hypothetical protein V6N11_017606 [Hibiscus sabdariffa]|uniref:Uncharacterized protein n=1 Tax=Hibiscus sabdariffa TaxID=183260 RepID=A0ABR2TYJ2_9ROSI
MEAKPVPLLHTKNPSRLKEPNQVPFPTLHTKKSPKIKFRVKSSNISIHSSIFKGDAGPIIAGEINATKPKTHACKEESLLVVDYQPTQAYIDEPAVANKNQKK